jgi:transposase
MDGTTFVGLDVHVKTIVVAVARGGGAAEELGVIPNTPTALAKRLRTLGSPDGLRVCYEAGPCGYGIHRQLSGLGIECRVVAPSLIPVRPGDRVKTDRRDAAKLARLLRSGDLTAVAVPTPEQEALRDLSRAREAAIGDRHRVRQRLVKLLARHGIAEPASGKRWTMTYWAWVSAVALSEPAAQVVLGELREAIASADARLARLTAALSELARASSQAPVIAALQRLHGVGLITAVGIVAEVGDLTRFDRAAPLFAYAGLVPSEHSSGGRRQRGGITKTGNRHLRFLLVEAAWHYARPIRRPPGEPADPADPVGAVAARARARLQRRYVRLVGRGKAKNVAVVAIARELLGFVWATAQAVTAAPAGAGDVALAA